MSTSAKVAILTGGGDCPGLNAVLRAVVRTAEGRFGWEVIGIEDGFDGLVEGLRWRHLSRESVRGLLTRGGTILGTSNRGNPFRYPVVESGETRMIDVSAQVADNFRSLGAAGLIAVGGDGTLKIAHELGALGVPVIGVPKTIDNDLDATDVTFGYHTAVAIVTEALDRLHTTAESHHRVMVVEVMGRDAGWIALEAGLAGSADVILIPEIPYDLAKVCRALQHRREQGRRFSIVVVAEGAAAADGQQVLQATATENRGVARLGGVGREIAAHLETCLDMETRTVVLGHVQRGGSPTHTDRLLGTRFGVRAMELAAAGEWGTMVALRGTRVVAVPLAEAIGQLKRVDVAGELTTTAEALGICLGR